MPVDTDIYIYTYDVADSNKYIAGSNVPVGYETLSANSTHQIFTYTHMIRSRFQLI